MDFHDGLRAILPAWELLPLDFYVYFVLQDKEMVQIYWVQYAD